MEMDDDGEFYLEPCNYKSLDGIVFRDNEGNEEVMPLKQYIEWNKPLHIKIVISPEVVAGIRTVCPSSSITLIVSND